MKNKLTPDLNKVDRFIPETIELMPVGKLLEQHRVGEQDKQVAIQDWLTNPPEDEFQRLIEATESA